MSVSHASVQTNPAASTKDFFVIIGLFLGVFVVGADSFIISPLLPTIGGALNASIEQVGLGVSIYAVCYALGAPFFGPLGDKLSRKFMFVTGLTIFLVGTLLCGIAWNISSFYVFRAIAGIGAALFTPNVWAFIGGHFTGAKMGKVMGIVMSALSLSIALGVPIGSFIANAVDWKWAFFGSAILGAIAFIIIITTVPFVKNNNVVSYNYFAQFSNVFKAQNAFLALLVTLTWMFSFYGVYTYLGSFIQTNYSFNTAQVGYVFIVYGLGNFIASFFGGWVMNALGAKRSVIINGILAAFIIGMLPFVGTKLMGLVILLAILSFVQGFGVTSLTAYIATIVPANRSTMMALNNSFIYLGLTLGSAIGGYIFESYAFTTLGLVAAGSNLLSILIASSLRKAN